MSRSLFVAMVLVFSLLLVFLQPKAVQKRSGSPKPKPAIAEQVCLQAPSCSGRAYRVSVLELIQHGNRYDRRLVLVSGQSVMPKRRKSPCGPYNYFVLKDEQGFFVPVTDYRGTDELVEQKRVQVLGFYRAEMHLIDVCQEVK